MKFLVLSLLLSAAPKKEAEPIPPPQPSTHLKMSLKGKTLFIGLLGVVTPGMEDELDAALDLARKNKFAVTIVIDSPGGYVAPATRMALSIVESNMVVQCVVGNRAASAAFLILQSCTLRIAHKNSKLMWHKTSTSMSGSIVDLQNTVKEMHELDVTLARPVCGRMGIPLDKCMAKYENGDWEMTPAQALINNAIDTIIPENY
jgi:ATP-dependent protease ClpP protease subunit